MNIKNLKINSKILLCIILFIILIIAFIFYKLVYPIILEKNAFKEKQNAMKTIINNNTDNYIANSGAKSMILDERAYDNSTVLNQGSFGSENGLGTYTNEYLDFKMIVPKGVYMSRPKDDEMHVTRIDENNIGYDYFTVKVVEGPALLNIEKEKEDNKKNYPSFEYEDGSDYINGIFFFTLSGFDKKYDSFESKKYYRDIDSRKIYFNY